jgi:hypothetical protein
MLTWQFIAVAVLLLYSPTILFLVFIVWRDGTFSPFSPRWYKPEIFKSDRVPYSRLASEIRNAAEHINGPLRNHSEIAERLALIQSCKLVMTTVGFEVGVHPWAGRVIADDDDNGSEAPPIAP